MDHVSSFVFFQKSCAIISHFTHIHEVAHPVVFLTLATHLFFHLPLANHLLFLPAPLFFLSVKKQDNIQI